MENQSPLMKDRKHIHALLKVVVRFQWLIGFLLLIASQLQMYFYVVKDFTALMLIAIH